MLRVRSRTVLEVQLPPTPLEAYAPMLDLEERHDDGALAAGTLRHAAPP